MLNYMHLVNQQFSIIVPFLVSYNISYILPCPFLDNIEDKHVLSHIEKLLQVVHLSLTLAFFHILLFKLKSIIPYLSNFPINE